MSLLPGSLWAKSVTRSPRFLRWSVVAMIATISALRIWALQAPEIAPNTYVAADIHPGRPAPGAGPFLSFVVALYPFDGPPVTIPLPEGLPKTFNLIAFSSDGRAIYGQKGSPLGPLDGIIKIEFKPTRFITVPGSLGLGGVSYLTAPPQSTKLFVSGATRSGDRLWHCGAFEVDPSSGSLRALRVGDYPQCGVGDGLAGPVSMDGRRMLNHQGNELDVIDLGTGLPQSLGVGLSEGRWSPDGRWIAAWGSGRIVVIDANNLSHRKDLGRCCDGGAHWSPDSKYLLLSRRELRCTLSLYFTSLEALDVATGKRTVIKSSRCDTGGWVGWIDRRVAE